MGVFFSSHIQLVDAFCARLDAILPWDRAAVDATMDIRVVLRLKGVPRFTPEFKEEAVRQIRERGYSVAEVSDRLGVSVHSLYKWLRAIEPDNSEQHARNLLEAKSEILKLRAQLKRTEEVSQLPLRLEHTT